MNFWDGLSELFAGAGIPLLFSIVACAVRALKRNKRLTWRQRASNLATAIFTGQVVWWGLDYTQDISIAVRTALTAMAAYGSNWLLDEFVFRIRKEVREGSILKRKKGAAE